MNIKDYRRRLSSKMYNRLGEIIEYVIGMGTLFIVVVAAAILLSIAIVVIPVMIIYTITIYPVIVLYNDNKKGR
jgi:ABC-type bacteriocin/lantibiotic exporter with double-glycine peptidase domain